MRLYLDTENKSRVAELSTDYICLLRWEGMPATVALGGWHSNYCITRDVRPSVRSFFSLSVVSVRGVHPMEEGGGRTAMFHRNLSGDKIRD